MNSLNEFHELSKLIEEHENFKINQKWRKRELFFKRSFLLFFSITLILLSIVLFSAILLTSKDILTFLFSFFILVVFSPTLYFLLKETYSELMKDSWKGKDMNKRYHYK